MANDIIKQLQAAAYMPNGGNTTNVLLFPQRAFAPSKPPRRGRRPKCDNVLKFTGKKIDNYDGEALRSEWQTCLADQLAQVRMRVINGEFTGLMIVGSRGVPTENQYPGGYINLSGVYRTDLAFAARHAELLAAEAEKLERDRPARPV